jgi:uncharacterized membrane protein
MEMNSYLNELSRLLANSLSPEEFNNVMQYYTEYFADAGIENQEEVHYLMPLRVMSYDVAEYERQASVIKKKVRKMKGIKKAEFLSGFLKENRLQPCVTLVLYYGQTRLLSELTKPAQ